MQDKSKRNLKKSIDNLFDTKISSLSNVRSEINDISNTVKAQYQFDLSIPPSTYTGKTEEETQYLLDNAPILVPSHHEKMTSIYKVFRSIFTTLPMYVRVLLCLMLLFLLGLFYPILSDGWESFMEDHFYKGIAIMSLLVVTFFFWRYLPWIESQMISLNS